MACGFLRSALRGPAAPVGALLLAATVALGGDVVEIEEHWTLTVGGPEASRSAPQVSMVMSATGDTESDYFLLTLNHWTEPGFSPGGVQAQHWNGSNCLLVANVACQQPLFLDGETIRWTQRLKLDAGELVYEVTDGQSETWGEFTAGDALTISTPTGLSRLNSYLPAVSIEESGIGFAGNRVSSLVLQKIRWRFDGEQEFHEMVAPIDINADLDP